MTKSLKVNEEGLEIPRIHSRGWTRKRSHGLVDILGSSSPLPDLGDMGKVFVCDENPDQGSTALMDPNNASSLRLRIFFGRLCKLHGPFRPLFLFECGDCAGP